MNFKRVYAIFLRQIILLKRGHFRLFSLFYWSTLDLFLWGILSGYLQGAGSGGMTFVGTLIGAVILSSFFFRVEQGISVAFLEDVWVRNFINLFASPITIHEYTVGLVLTSVFDTAIAISFMIFVAWFLFAYSIFQFGLLLVPFIALLFVFGWAIGLFATAVVLRWGPSAEMIVWSVPALMTPFSAVFYPVSALHPFLQKVALVIPNAYVFEGMRSAALGGVFDVQKFGIGLFLAVVYFFLAYWFLYRSYRSVLRRGLFSRFVTN